jgi:hypothetical protein
MKILQIKQTISLLLFFWMNVICVMAQEQDPWVGTWTSGIYQTVDHESNSFKDFADYRYVIRITKSEGNYYVRAKSIKVANPQSAIYDDSSAIKYTKGRFDGNSIWLESCRDRIPFYKNGRIDSYSNTISYFKITLNNGVLHCSFYKWEHKSYDINMRYLSTTTFNLHDQYPGPCVERDLYNPNIRSKKDPIKCKCLYMKS